MKLRLLLDIPAGCSFLAATTPSAELDFDTKSPRIDVSGQPIFITELVMIGGQNAEVLRVRTIGKPLITSGEMVKATGLVGNPWNRGDKSGISFWADRIESVSVKS